MHPPDVYARERRAPTVYHIGSYQHIWSRENGERSDSGSMDEKGARTNIVDESDTLNVNMFTVKSFLKKLDDVLSYSVLRSETFGPCEENARIEG